jgi:enoyl-CoA hydratase/carnithine racemase
MAEKLILLERRVDGVAVVTLDHPKVNALSTELNGQLAEIAADLTAEPPGAVVVTGGPRVFAAGADITEFGGQEEARAVVASFRSALDAVAAIPCMVIAAVNGYALGGGCELALACDMRVGTSRSKFGQPEVLLGIIPGGGGTQRLTRLVGPSRSKDICCSGRMVDVVEAHRIGLVDRISDDEDAFDLALGLAQEFARGALLAQAAMKVAIDGGVDMSLSAGLDLEAAQFVGVFGTEDSQTGVASFLANGPGKAEFIGR